jgi:CRP-like cAMP-binding protein
VLRTVLVTRRRVRNIDREASIPVVEMGLLRNIGVFAALPAAPLETLAHEASYVAFAPGERVIAEGEEGECYYAITDGQVAVSKDGREIRRMGRGEGFGEISLLHSVRRTATVAAVSATTLLTIESDAFLAALNANTHVREAAGHRAEELLADAS